MKDDTGVNSNIIQYADDTFIFCSGKTISESKLHFEKSIAKLILFQEKWAKCKWKQNRIHYFLSP